MAVPLLQLTNGRLQQRAHTQVLFTYYPLCVQSWRAKNKINVCESTLILARKENTLPQTLPQEKRAPNQLFVRRGILAVAVNPLGWQ